MNSKQIKAAIEAVLFASGGAVPLERIAQALEIKKSEAIKQLVNLQSDYEKDTKGLTIIKLQDSWQMCNKKEYGEYIRKVMDLRRNTPLSQAAMEVLAVIAYNQPVTKAFVEQVRGVDCSGVIGSLTTKELIEEKGRLELPGRPLLYGTTENFLRCFQLDSIESLPPLPEKEEDKAENNSENPDSENNSTDSEIGENSESKDKNTQENSADNNAEKKEQKQVEILSAPAQKQEDYSNDEQAEDLLEAMGIVREVPHSELFAKAEKKEENSK